jgi:F-type H+-transporting ATPase subunit delta
MPSALALRYARALADVVAFPGAAAGDPRRIGEQLREFDQMLGDHAELQILFTTPAIPEGKKRAVLTELAPLLDLAPHTLSFLLVVLQHDRMAHLAEIAEAFDSLLNERLGIVVAAVRSARPLEEPEKQELASALRARTGKQVEMTFTLDPGLIAGVVAQVGSTIYDGSVRGQLERLRIDLTR